MAISDVLEHIDREIAILQQARELLAGTEPSAPKPTRGRPKGSRKAKVSEGEALPAKTKRKLSPEGRKAIADAMKRRWADRRKANAS